MRIEPFAYFRPATLREACALLGEHAGDARLLAGGTDLVPRLKQQIVRPGCILDMTDVRDHCYVRSDGSGLAIGAGTTLHAIATSNVVREQTPMLAEAARRVASQQIRHLATLGGNLCLETRCWFYNQSHAWKRAKPNCYKAGGQTCYVVNKPAECYATFQGDTAPALLALGARVSIVSSAGERTVPLQELYSGKGEAPLTLAPGELLAEVQIPASAAGSGTAYLKFSHRKAVDFPLASVAVWLSVPPGQDRCAEARVALSGVGSAPVRAPEAEQALIGRAPDEAAAEAAEAATKAARPVRNLHHGQPALRRKMVGILTKLAIEEAMQQTHSR